MLQKNTVSPFRKSELFCLHALSFISLVALILFIATTNAYSAHVTLAWSSNTEPDLAGYKIYTGPSSGNYDNVHDVGNETNYTIQNLTEGQTYFIALTAYNTLNNESGYSESVVYTVPILDLTTPSTPTSLQATTISTSQIDLSWNASSDNIGVTGYRIYRDGTQIATTSNTTYQDTELSISTMYSYTVTAYDAAENESGQSSASSATTLSPPGNNPPVLDQISNITVNEGATITLNPTATDPDGDALTYTYAGWMTSSSYTTNSNDSGTHTVMVTVSDGTLTDSQIVTIIVLDSNNSAPVLVPITNIKVNEGATITLSPTAIDQDGDALTYTYSGWMSSSSYTTNYDDAGTHTVTVTVSDGLLSDSQVVTIIVNDTARIVSTITAGDIDGSGQDDVIIDYGPGHGIWMQMNNNGWVMLHDQSSEIITTGDIDGNGQDEVIINFGLDYGIWTLMNLSTWVQSHPLSPESITTGDIDGNGQDEIIVDFGLGYGIWVKMNNNEWIKLHGLSPEIITTGDMDGNGQDEIIIDFGNPYGVWVRMNNSTWVRLNKLSPEIITTGDIDGNGQDEVIIDFGKPYGVWVRMNNNEWVKLHDLSPEVITTGDIDGNGQDEVIIDFGDTNGTWALMNNNTYAKLNDLSPEVITTGDIDGNGQDEVIMDFGTSNGIKLLMNNGTLKAF